MNCRCSFAAIFVRSLHTILTVAVVSSLILSDTSLRNGLIYRENLVYALSYLACVLFSFVMYWTACLTDPGFVPLPPDRRFTDWEEDSDGEISLESSQMLTNGIRLRKCGYCGIVQPLRARHCQECDRCVRKYDHHCPWLGTCVGEGNHRFFWLFLASKSFVILWSAGICWHSFVLVGDHVFQQNLIFVVDTGVLFLSGFVVISLLCLHTHIMLTNTTTWEMLARDKITYLKGLKPVGLNPFHEGYCKNMCQFLCRWTVRQWDRVYNRKIEEKEGEHGGYSADAVMLNRQFGGFEGGSHGKKRTNNRDASKDREKLCERSPDVLCDNDKTGDNDEDNKNIEQNPQRSAENMV